MRNATRQVGSTCVTGRTRAARPAVSKIYETAAARITALENMNWSVGGGEAVALMGPSGCGKTTILNLLGGMDRPSEGEIWVNGENVAAMNERQLEVYRLRKVGFVFQFFNLIPSLSAIENLELPMLLAGVNADERRGGPKACSTPLALRRRASSGPRNYRAANSSASPCAWRWSTIRRSSSPTSPPATSTTTTRRIISSMLIDLATSRGKTVIVASHDPKVVEHFPRVYHMRDGAIEQVPDVHDRAAVCRTCDLKRRNLRREDAMARDWRCCSASLARGSFSPSALSTFLIVFLLAAVTVTSRHAMQRYVDDQVERVPWDLSVYQTADVPLAGNAPRRHRQDARRLAGRAPLFPAHDPALLGVMPVIDGQQLRTPWLSFLLATDPSLIPPDIRPPAARRSLVLVGSKAQMGDAFLRLQNRKQFELVVQPKDRELGHGRRSPHKHPLGVLTISHRNRTRHPHRLRPNQSLVSWRQTSSPTLVPELGMILVAAVGSLADPQFRRGLARVHARTWTRRHPRQSRASISLRSSIWRKLDRAEHRLGMGHRRLAHAHHRRRQQAHRRRAGPDRRSAAVDHNLGTMFIRMNDIAKKIALISLLVSLPLLLMAGILLANLSACSAERASQAGPLRLRGTSPAGSLARRCSLAIGAGGLAGGVAGGVLGTLFRC